VCRDAEICAASAMRPGLHGMEAIVEYDIGNENVPKIVINDTIKFLS